MPKAVKTRAILPRVRVLSGRDIALGPGKVELLDRVRETGSIAEAARQMGMSYNRAWLLIRTINRCFAGPLVIVARGGAQGGGAQLTATGRRVVELYHQMEKDFHTTTRPAWRELQKLMN